MRKCLSMRQKNCSRPTSISQYCRGVLSSSCSTRSSQEKEWTSKLHIINRLKEYFVRYHLVASCDGCNESNELEQCKANLTASGLLSRIRPSHQRLVERE